MVGLHVTFNVKKLTIVCHTCSFHFFLFLLIKILSRKDKLKLRLKNVDFFTLMFALLIALLPRIYSIEIFREEHLKGRYYSDFDCDYYLINKLGLRYILGYTLYDMQKIKPNSNADMAKLKFTFLQKELELFDLLVTYYEFMNAKFESDICRAEKLSECSRQCDAKLKEYEKAFENIENEIVDEKVEYWRVLNRSLNMCRLKVREVMSYNGIDDLKQNLKLIIHTLILIYDYRRAEHRLAANYEMTITDEITLESKIARMEKFLECKQLDLKGISMQVIRFKAKTIATFDTKKAAFWESDTGFLVNLAAGAIICGVYSGYKGKT